MKETWLNKIYKNMTTLIPESKEIFETKLRKENNIQFNYDKMTEHTLRNNRSYILTERKNWEINNYQRFIDIVEKTPTTPVNLKGFLTKHDMDEITQSDLYIKRI